MKKLIFPVVIALGVIGYISCSKDGSGSSSKTSISASKTTNIKKGEPVIFAFKGAGGTVSWSVTPSTGTQITLNKGTDTAIIVFGAKGSYAVKGTSSNGPADMTVSVSDSTYTTSAGSTTQPLTGDNLTITPSRYDSGSNSGLQLLALTTNKYSCLNASLITSQGTSGNVDSVIYSGVSMPSSANCSSGQTQVSGYSGFYPVTDGTYTLKIIFNGTTYSGSFTKSGKTYTITWPYTTGVVVYPLVIN